LAQLEESIRAGGGGDCYNDKRMQEWTDKLNMYRQIFQSLLQDEGLDSKLLDEFATSSPSVSSSVVEKIVPK